jgi:hypothetical protein
MLQKQFLQQFDNYNLIQQLWFMMSQFKCNPDPTSYWLALREANAEIAF